MADKAWKAFERRVARDFGSVRTSLSGGNGKVTRSDSHHPDFFLECKHNQESAIWTLYLKTRELARAEKKLPVVIQGRKRNPGYLLVLHSDDIEKFFRKFYGKLVPVPFDTPSNRSPTSIVDIPPRKSPLVGRRPGTRPRPEPRRGRKKAKVDLT